VSRRGIVLLVSLFLAVLAAFSVWRYLSAVEDNVRADITEVSVFRAFETIPEGTDGTVAAASIEPATALAENVVAFTDIVCTGPSNLEEGADLSICDGHPTDLPTLLNATVANVDIPAGSLISSAMFVAPTEVDTDALSAEIPESKVGFALDAGSVGSVGGWIQPGDRVNVIATFTLDVTNVNDLLANPDTRQFVLDNVDLSGLLGSGQTPTTIVDEETGEVTVVEPGEDALSQFANTLPDNVRFTQTVLQNIDVIAFGNSSRERPGASEEGPSVEAGTVVVLEVTPAEAEMLEFVRQNAQVSMTLLPQDSEYTEFASGGVTVDEIFTFIDRLRDQLAALGG
jgi:Flp pilus assembly protein CpaB